MAQTLIEQHEERKRVLEEEMAQARWRFRQDMVQAGAFFEDYPRKPASEEVLREIAVIFTKNMIGTGWDIQDIGLEFRCHYDADTHIATILPHVTTVEAYRFLVDINLPRYTVKHRLRKEGMLEGAIWMSSQALELYRRVIARRGKS